MSNFLAIATVTATLSRILQAAIGEDVSGTTVTTQRPDSAGSAVSEPRVNLYLYQVTPNPALRNIDTPTRRSDGSLIQRPQVALDLHYLLTFYGDETEFIPQRLLGSTVRTLHSQPTLTRAAIRSVIRSPDLDFLLPSDLAEQVESVRFTPLLLNLEELSKLWSVFFQTPYALSVAYQGSAVLIESEETPRSALPVRDRNIYILPFRYPIIERVQSTAGSHQPITRSSNLTILGKDLKGQTTQLQIGDAPLPDAAITNLSNTQITLALTNLSDDQLRAGIQGIQVIHPLQMGTPPVPHRGIESNIAAFVLRPIITVSDQSITDRTTENGVTYCTGSVTVKFAPVVGRTQRVALLLNELLSPSPTSTTARAYRFETPAQNGITDPQIDVTDTIVIPISRVASGTYLVRVQVDGAESLLTLGADPGNPDDLRYIDPQVTIV